MPLTVIDVKHASEISHPINGSINNRQIPLIVTISEPVTNPFDDTGDKVVRQYLEDNTPLIWDGLPRNDIDLGQITSTKWRAALKYSLESNSSSRSETPAGGKWSFKIATETAKAYIAFSQKRYPSSGVNAAPDRDNFINVSKSENSMKVEGFDIPFPIQEWSYRVTVNRSFFDTPLPAPPYPVNTYYLTLVESLVPSVNNAPYRGRAIGEVLFKGITGEIPDTGYADLTWEFALKYREDVQVTIGGIDVPAGDGIWAWDGVWAEWKEVPNAGINDIEVGANGVYYPRVLRATNFDLLGLI